MYFVKAFDTVPREMLFKVLARLGFPPKIVNLVRQNECSQMSNELESDSAMVMNLESFGVDGAGYDGGRSTI